ncbi:DUF2382 domain-containing protein [Amycolatopsis suaedae]|uniref:DUF2382 domain-containing protein n=1 Tax=Amycolatopsis suaedae TaxID=2510978 RepID=A0A4V2ELZ8_9PSEU|nr:PRC and DUF2382 domain-containing protein [Amycolatopsis suaedae]RZQ63315.1 DUF2382 domain-containing protein [Amycolatopsis suaedae]
MTRTMRPQDLVESPVVDNHGSKIGKVGTVYLSDDTRQPEWVTVKTGLFGQKESFVPLRGADLDDEGLHVRVDKEKVADSPHFDADGHLSQQECMRLYEYYGIPVQGGGRRPMDTTGRADQAQAGMAGTAGRHERTDHAAAMDDQQEMVRSEERLKVGTEETESGRVRLRKYVVTEEQQVTVPVSHEEVRIEREPIRDGDRSTAATIGEEEHDVVLHAEKPVVDKETVAVERVRMGTERVTEEQTVSGEIRKEQIDVDDDTKRNR